MFISLSISVVCVLALSLIVTIVGPPDYVITLINYLIKLVSIGVGVFAFVSDGKGALKGLIFGAVYAVLSYLIFSLIVGGKPLGVSFFLSLLYCVIVSTVLGVLAVNVKRR